MNILLELQYLPCVQYMSKFYGFDQVIIDDIESFEKQSFRNRCTIAGANGAIDIIVPVHQSRSRLPIKEVLIDNHTHWQHQHWQSIRSAYSKTAFFEHYADTLEGFYHKEWGNLFDFNKELLTAVMKLIKIDHQQLQFISGTSEKDYLDYKSKIHPKERFRAHDDHFVLSPYHQAFTERYGFLPNLSITDLIFNEGPRTKDILMGAVL